MSRQHTALRCRRRNKVEIELGLLGVQVDQSLVNNAARRRVRGSSSLILNEETLMDPLVHHDNYNLRFGLAV
jgi:hypothetical protein